jgi:hypothetical protein
VNASQRKGTDGERRVVEALLPHWPMAERRAKQGTKDRGDIGGVAPGLVIEVKAQPKDYRIGEWLKECDAEAVNDNADLAVVWFKLRGKGDPLDWPVMMRGRFFIPVLRHWVNGA